MNVYSGLPISATERCFWNLFFTRVHQMLLHLSPVDLLFPASPTQLHLTEILETKFTKSQPHEADIRLHNFYYSSPSPPTQKAVLPVVELYAVSVLLVYAHQTVHSAMKCHGKFACSLSVRYLFCQV